MSKVKNPLRDMPVEWLEPTLQRMPEPIRRKTLNKVIKIIHDELHAEGAEHGATEKHAALLATRVAGGSVIHIACDATERSWDEEDREIMRRFDACVNKRLVAATAAMLGVVPPF
jgi:hypothetical protein